ncbi:S41 family peptidase [Chitinophaga alhagiae]|uniref:S41 family peptidase n=1 Tax=Chitinophaga alhagiae TaxID=2203219 RepID=UPI0013003201|nr:S41 family peptidase [Chitinophaga alhagiae]
MPVWLFICILSQFNFSCNTHTGPESSRIAPEDLLHDFAIITRLIESSSPYPFYMTERGGYDSLKASIKEWFKDSLTKEEFFYAVYPLVKSLKNPHYSIAPVMTHTDSLESRYFPFSVFIENDSLFIDENFGNEAGQDLHGKYVSSINGQKTYDILSQLHQGVSYAATEISYINYTLESSFGKQLHTLLGMSGQFNIEIEGHMHTYGGVRINLLKKKDVRSAIYDSIIHANEKQIGYLKIHNLNPNNAKEWDVKLPAFFRKLSLLKVRKLVIDMRDNFGGSSALTRKLMNYIAPDKYSLGDEARYSKDAEIAYEPSPLSTPKNVPDKFAGECILLVNAGTFSSAHMFFCGFKHYKMGVTAGEPGIERFLISGELKEMELERTKCKFYYPTSNFVLPGFSGTIKAPVMPDIVIPRLLHDRINQRDGQLDSIISLVDLKW